MAGDPNALRAWALAWDDGDGNADLFRPELLDDPATFVLAGRSADGRVVTGAVASRSDQAVGISNVFALDGGPDAAWPVVLDAVTWLFPTLPVVGYEQGNALRRPSGMVSSRSVRCGSGCTASNQTGSRAARARFFSRPGPETATFGENSGRSHLTS